MEPTRAGDDAELLARWRGGDVRAGEALFDRYFDEVYDFFARRLTVDVSDLVQRTFLGCVEARDRFRGDSSFRTFLYSVARHELYGYFRARKRSGALDFSVSSIADLAPGPSTLQNSRTAREALTAALRSLPVDQQIAVELRYWEGLSGPELADVLEVPEGTVRSRLRRALEGLRDALASHPRGRELVTTLTSDADAALEAWVEGLAAARG